MALTASTLSYLAITRFEQVQQKKSGRVTTKTNNELMNVPIACVWINPVCHIPLSSAKDC